MLIAKIEFLACLKLTGKKIGKFSLISHAVRYLQIANDEQIVDRARLMSTLDELNDRYGRGTILLASAGLAGDHRNWSMKQERRTPGYTTS